MEDLVVELRYALGRQRGLEKLSQTEFGRKLGLSLPSIAKYESGVKPTPDTIKEMIRLAKSCERPDLVKGFQAALRGEKRARTQAETVELIYEAVVALRKELSLIRQGKA